MTARESAKTTSMASTVAQKVDQAAITRYKHRIDAKYPIRERDLRYPSRASLLGCLCLKLALVFIVAAFLIMRSLGLDGQAGFENPLAVGLVFNDLSFGWCVYGLISLFTYLYLRIKNPLLAVLVFCAFVGVCALAFAVWEALAPFGGSLLLTIFLTICGVVPFVMDVWGLLRYRPGVPIG